VGANGEQIHIPDSVYQVLRQVVHAMARGQAISIVPHEREMTTQEAADLLNVSRPFLIKLLEEGEIPYIKVGTHRRVRSQDLMSYKEQRDNKRAQLLDSLIQMSEDAGFYED
jgi:excisionase family DNA binding protein